LSRLLVLVLIVGLVVGGIWLRYGGGEPFPDRTGPPELPASALQVVADLPYPPGNVAVSPDGRVFFTFHPEGSPPIHVAEWVGGKAVPYPPDLPDYLAWQSPLALRVDRQNRLWVLDNGHHGFGTPRLVAFDLATGKVANRYGFSAHLAGWGSHLNDFQVSPDGKHVYIADASLIAKTPALLVLDVERGSVRRLLEGHESVTPEDYVLDVQGRRMVLLGIFAIRPGVDSIALDRQGEWLYFAPVTSTHLYRVRTADLDDPTLAPDELARRVERFAEKPPSDGITTDVAGDIYLTDPDQSAIVMLTPEGKLRTLVKDPRLRWPDGFSFGPDGWLYVTSSALQQVILRSSGEVASNAPYQIFRLKPGVPGIPGQ
jgi:sugar lactone lactonase YvrE